MVSEKKSVKILQSKVTSEKNKNNNNQLKAKISKKQPILLLPPPPMPKTPQISEVTKNLKFLQFVGPSCGHHASYVFYKAIKYMKNGREKVLSLGEFFFVKIWPNSDLVAIGELQLLWEDKNTNQTLSSLRLYFLPEYTPEGRMHYHGEDEIVAVSEKAVLRVSDLLDWIASPKEIQWDRGLKGICEADCEPLPSATKDNNSEKGSKEQIHQYDKGLNAKFSPGHSEFLADVRLEKEAIGDVPDLNDSAVVIINSSQYSRYRAVLRRIQGAEKYWMHNSLIVSLGGFTTPTRKTHILFCREIFDYAELEEHPYLCNHLAPKLKGRPRKRKKIKRPGSPESESASSESSTSTSVVSLSATSTKSKNGIKKDLLSILSQKNTKEETEFLKKLISFMECRNTPIERPPMLGYKQIDLHLFFDKVSQVGGYDGCMSKKAWKSVYDDLGGNPQNTSAATCTRRHYEKFLLPYERHTKGQEEKHVKRRESDSGSEKSPASSIETKRERSKSENSEDNPKEEPTEPVDEEKPQMPPPPKTPPEVIKENQNSVSKSEDSKLNPLLDQVKNLIGTSKPESQMKIDPEGKQLQIDDLIIIPNNISSTPPEGGSALQNLAKIASRYQNQPKDIIEVSAPKKAKVEEQPVKPTPMPPSSSASSMVAPSAASLAALAAMNPMTMTPAQQQSLFAMLQHPSLFGMPNKTTPSSTPTKGPQAASSASAAASLYSPFFGDPSKLGPEALKLLQMFDSSLKAAVGNQGSGSASGVPSTKTGSSPKPRNASGSSTNTSSSPSTSSSAKDARSKVTRLPMDAKRPPALQGHSPCAFAQTSNIYTNPFVDLNKAKESSSANSDGALDLTRNARQLAPSVPPMMGGGGGGINLRKESTLKANPMMDMVQAPRRNEVKVSPFSAEALLSKSSSSSSAAPGSSSSRPPSSHHSSHHHPKVDLSSRMTPSSRENSERSSKSPWHTPVSTQARPIQPTKPAIPVSPVVREDKSKPDMSFQAALLGLGGVVPPTSSAGGVSAANAALAAAAGMPLPPTSYGSLSAAANPYLAMAQAAQGLPKTSSAAAAAMQAAATPSFPASHMMDPTSAYYAALYSQSLYAGMASPYAGMRLPGMSAPPAPPPAAPPAGSMPPGMDLLTLHAMMSRGQTPSSANPFAGYPPGLLGFPGFPGGQPHSSGRKDP